MTGKSVKSSVLPRSRPSAPVPAVELGLLEPMITQLINGVADPHKVAAQLKAMGLPGVLDQTEQLRLALRLLECHDEPVIRERPGRRPEPSP